MPHSSRVLCEKVGFLILGWREVWQEIADVTFFLVELFLIPARPRQLPGHQEAPNHLIGI